MEAEMGRPCGMHAKEGRKEGKNESKKGCSVSINDAINCYECSISGTWMIYGYMAMVKWWQGKP